MIRNVKIDFYKVEMPEDDSRTFEDIIQVVNESPDDESRIEKYNNVPLRLQEALNISDLWVGHLVKIRMDGIPPKTKLSGEESNIELDDDEGLGEEATFLYDRQSKVLVLQRSRFSITANAFAAYWEMKCNIEEIILLPVLNINALARMNSMELYRKLEIAFAGLDSMRGINNDHDSLEKFIDLSRQYQAPIVSVTLSMGHNRGSLRHISRLISNVLRLNQTAPEAVRKIILTGKEDDDSEKQVIDFVEDRMYEVEKIDLGRDFITSREARKQAILHAYNKRKRELRSMFIQP